MQRAIFLRNRITNNAGCFLIILVCIKHVFSSYIN